LNIVTLSAYPRVIQTSDSQLPAVCKSDNLCGIVDRKVQVFQSSRRPVLSDSFLMVTLTVAQLSSVYAVAGCAGVESAMVNAAHLITLFIVFHID
jgi:hypothetical protein